MNYRKNFTQSNEVVKRKQNYKTKFKNKKKMLNIQKNMTRYS